MTEIDTTQILIGVVVAVLGILGIWLGSGYLARNFEKRKKLYDAREGLYKDLADTLEISDWISRSKEYHRHLGMLLIESRRSQSEESLMELRKVATESRGTLSQMKLILGLTEPFNFEDPKEVLDSFWLPIEEISELDHEEIFGLLYDDYSRQYWEILRCQEVNSARISRESSNLKVMDRKCFSDRVRYLATLLDKPKSIEGETWQLMVDDFLSALAKDLGKTL